MEKAVMISIRPEWVDKILSGEKTVEIRKTRPRLKVPFKCYIYCTKGDYYTKDFAFSNVPEEFAKQAFGNVVAEFICDSVKCIMAEQFVVKEDAEKALEGSLMTINQAKNYAKWKKGTPHYECKDLCGWHISSLRIYDAPKRITSFTCIREGIDGMGWWPMNRAPQSWGYVITGVDDADET